MPPVGFHALNAGGVQVRGLPSDLVDAKGGFIWDLSCGRQPEGNLLQNMQREIHGRRRPKEKVQIGTE